MSKRVLFINLLLVPLVVLLAVKAYEEWTRPLAREVEVTPEKARPAVPPSPAVTPGRGDALGPTRFKAISEKNIFSPERKEFPAPLIGANGKKSGATRPNVTLYGVAVGEEFQSALINNPTRRPEKGERDTISVRVGDRVGDYKVSMISLDRITLEMEGDTFDVLLYDPARPKKRATPPVTPTPPTPQRASPGTAVSPRTGAPAPVLPRPFTPPQSGITQPGAVTPGTSRPSLPPPRQRLTTPRTDLRRVPAQPPRAPDGSPGAQEADGEEEED